MGYVMSYIHWEYKRTRWKSDGELCELGDRGWEIIAATDDELIWKREAWQSPYVPDPREATS